MKTKSAIDLIHQILTTKPSRKKKVLWRKETFDFSYRVYDWCERSGEHQHAFETKCSHELNELITNYPAELDALLTQEELERKHEQAANK